MLGSSRRRAWRRFGCRGGPYSMQAQMANRVYSNPHPPFPGYPGQQQAQFPYSAAGAGAGPTSASSWTTSAVGQNAYLSPQNAPMRPPYGTHQGYPDGQSPFVNQGQPQFGGGRAAVIATQGMRVMPGYEAYRSAMATFSTSRATFYTGHPVFVLECRVPTACWPRIAMGRTWHPPSITQPRSPLPTSNPPRHAHVTGSVGHVSRISGRDVPAGMEMPSALSDYTPPSGPDSHPVPPPSTHSDLLSAGPSSSTVSDPVQPERPATAELNVKIVEETVRSYLKRTKRDVSEVVSMLRLDQMDWFCSTYLPENCRYYAADFSQDVLCVTVRNTANAREAFEKNKAEYHRSVGKDVGVEMLGVSELSPHPFPFVITPAPGYIALTPSTVLK
ncbi:uncharacterized protein LOC129587309 [Paramacrobiotus metropolitanus]|uniref:uncharacterized protein LOC129587309 n=1 Tax=Paramacrobiotus metropolitanus TaxID=2943436 RepID=UPI00244585B1|nr:uncharacterized protein LOC129587309 [Paramacrobiotus metropolitanus]